MVRGLVEEEYVGARQEDFGQLDAHAPAARKFRCRAVEIIACKSEAEECFLCLGPEVF